MSEKPVNLRELGYQIEPLDGADGFIFHVVGPAPDFFIKKSPRGHLRAYKTKDAQADSTIEGLYDFNVTGEGESLDLVGKRSQPVAVSTGKRRGRRPKQEKAA